MKPHVEDAFRLDADIAPPAAWVRAGGALHRYIVRKVYSAIVL